MVAEGEVDACLLVESGDLDSEEFAGPAFGDEEEEEAECCYGDGGGVEYPSPDSKIIDQFDKEMG
jgi:hypothetical protein